MPYKDPGKQRAYSAWYRQTPKAKAIIAARRAKEKRLVFAHYGDKCSWPGCDVSIRCILQIHHSNGGGNKHRRDDKKANQLYHWLIEHNFPPNFELLCMNHHGLKDEALRKARAAARKEGATE